MATRTAPSRTSPDDRPRARTLGGLRREAATCRACPLWEGATQTVFGEGPPSAKLVLVGEQPGDREDQEGHPFVGPAGGVLASALEEAGIERDEVYVTNAVKHFKWRQGRGKRRLHQRPNAAEINACQPWLEAELAVIEPKLVACLGATAARALLGTRFRVTRDRGTFVESKLGWLATATIHPSAILRMDDEDERAVARADLVRDLSGMARKLDSL
jgi:uracil-DNA glycosylase family protein